MMRNKSWVVWIGLGLAVVLPGCGTARETVTERTATEQALISSAADRAINEAALDGCAARKIFIDAANLEAVDKPYVVGRLQKAVLDKGGILAEAKDADVVLHIASGALATDESGFLFGVPALPIPIPGAGIFETPELSLFKIRHRSGRAKLLINAVDAKTQARLWESPITQGESKQTNLWLLMTGPYGWGNAWD